MDLPGSPQVGEKFERLVAIMARLRSPGGCPWDREQTFATLKKYLVEEAYEVLEAIDNGDMNALAEELGDLMLQPVFLAQMASEAGHFSIADSLDAITGKLIRRHPHVFGDTEARTAGEVTANWERIKAAEKQESGARAARWLDTVPRALPALMEAQKIGGRAAKAGFDWPSARPVLDKIREECDELEQAFPSAGSSATTEELGDLLFAVVNLARHLDVDAEQALRAANAKFRRRFAHIEERLKQQERQWSQATLEEMEALWTEAKQLP